MKTNLSARRIRRLLPIAAVAAMLAMLATAGPRGLADSAPSATEPDGSETDGPPSSNEITPPINERFAAATAEAPDFQRHVSPLLGRLGCNGRACHGSFQGQGGFRLSLFGYDLPADHAALTESGAGRVNVDDPEQSLILRKATLAEDHEGGERFKADSWAYRVLRNWIANRAVPTTSQSAKFVRLVVTPTEINFTSSGETVALRAVAEWSDGSREDVTPLCRFRTNDESIAIVGDDGVVRSANPGNTHVVAFYDNGVTPVEVIRPVSDLVGERYPRVPAPTKIDELVTVKLRKLGIVPSDLATDAEFLRRLSLDMTGTLPTPQEVEAFLADPAADKRKKKIEELLASEAYAAWWTTKLCDITGNNPRRSADQQVADQQARQWYDWIHRRVRENAPYDELVEGIVMAVSRQPDQSYVDYCQEMSSYFREEKPADFSRRETMPYFWSRGREGAQPKEKAMAFSYAFLGVRLACAECHKHPFDQWTKDDFDQFTAFFQPVSYGNSPETRPQYRAMLEAASGGLKGGQAQRKLAEAVKRGDTVPWREVFVARNRIPESVAARPGKNKKANKGKKRRPAARVVTPKLLGDEQVELARNEDPRAALMEWMREKDNPYFARAFVNRVWAAYFNVGIIEPPDDMNLANPPSNGLLLDYLAEGFIASGYDMKWVHRQIAGSRTYQLSWRTNETNRLDERHFSHAVLRRLPAEVAYDAISLATAGDEELVALRNDLQKRAIGPGSGVRRGGIGQFALGVFGKPERATNCDCERSVEPSLLQALFLRNDQDVLRMIDRKEGWLVQVSRELGQPIGGAPKRQERAGRESDKDPAAKEATAAQLRRQIGQVEKRLELFKDRGDKERVRRAERRVARLKNQLREAERREERQRKAKIAARPISDKKSRGKDIAAPEPNQGASAAGKRAEAETREPDVGQIIRLAYLRTLSRPPTADEEQRIRRHLGATGKVAGLRDTLWALINSKEFILNH